MPRKSLDPPENLPKEAPCQVALGQLQDEVPRMPDQAPAGLEKVLLDSIDVWILTRRSLIDQRRRALLPVVRERQALADALACYMALLGLERRTRPPVPLADLVLRARREEAQP
jgi:hypothetical protein